MSEWIERLRAEAERTSITAAAAKIGYKRPSVSLALSGKYPGDTGRLEQAVLANLADQVKCPHLEDSIPTKRCRSFATRPMPTSDKNAFRHWSACQECPQRPKETQNG